jgi:hypothetical protein
MADWPWCATILRAEAPEVRDRIVCHSVNHGEISTLLRNSGVGGVEVNDGPLSVPCCDALSQRGFKVKLHLGPKLLAVSRSCVELKEKAERGAAPLCPGMCTGFKRLGLHSLESSSVALDGADRARTVFPELLVAGAGVFDGRREADGKPRTARADVTVVTLVGGSRP